MILLNVKVFIKTGCKEVNSIFLSNGNPSCVYNFITTNNKNNNNIFFKVSSTTDHHLGKEGDGQEKADRQEKDMSSSHLGPGGLNAKKLYHQSQMRSAFSTLMIRYGIHKKIHAIIYFINTK